MIDGKFALAFTTGMFTAVNPCGFAMLPAYLSFFLGTEQHQRTLMSRLARALVVSAAMTLGFIAVFVVIGSILRNSIQRVTGFSGWATVVIAVVLIALGIAVTAGWRIPMATPKLNKGGQSGTFSSMFVFGVSYAIASLGCSLALFIGNVFNGTKRDGIASGLTSMALYGLGMGLIITALTLSLAATSGGLVRLLRKAMRYVDRAAGVFLVVAGIYLFVYGIEEIKLSNGTIGSSRLTRTGTSWASKLQNFLQERGPVTLGVILAVIVAATTAAVIVGRRRSTAQP